LQDYFSEIRRLHHENPDSSRAFYVCPIVFDRNSNETPILVRVADMLWGAAGLAGYLPWASIHIPTSVYSLPIGLAQEVGGWDGDSTAIGEDMHMLLKCYFNTGGHIITTPIFSPASQCNISTEYNQRWRKTLFAVRGRYQQALRHMWGSLDTGYAVRRAFKTRRFRLNHIPLFHLLWEAHFIPVHFVIILIGTALYSIFTPAASMPPAVLKTLWATAIIRNLSMLVMQAVFTVYEDYHGLCVNARAQDMRRAGIIGTTFSFRKHGIVTSMLERASALGVGIVYGAAPALHAQMCHFWTENLNYKVTPKLATFHQPA
jgi:Glycosyl transferase family group 2